MIPHDEMLRIARQLTDKTRRGHANWKAAKRDADDPSQWYHYSERDVRFQLGYVVPDAGEDYYRLNVFDADEEVGELLTDSFLDADEQDQTLVTLFREVEKLAGTWKESLAKINELLTQD